MSFEKALELKARDTIDIDIPLKLPLFDYQKVGAAFMYSVKKCFNLDDPGLGKTSQSIGYLWLLTKAKKRRVKALVVGTSATIYQWKDEFKKFSDFTAVIPDGSKAARVKMYDSFMTDDNTALIINYTKILHDFDYIRKIKFDTVIFDEASSLKDNSSQIHKFYKWLCAPIDRVVMLTATPISTNLDDFYNLFDIFSIEGYLPDFPTFRENFLITKDVRVKKGSRTFTVKTVVGSKNVKEFQQLLDPFYIRRENNQGVFASLKLIPHRHALPMTREQKQLSQKMRLDFFNKKEDERVALKLYSDFVKISCCPAIFDPNYSIVSPKAMALTELVLSTPKKVVIFAKFIEFHKILRAYFKKAGISFVSITGLESPKEKDMAKKQFWEDPDTKAILLTGAGKFGLNLQITNRICFADIPETPSDVFQYIGRVYRTGQEEDPQVDFFFSADSVEEDNFKTLFARQKVIDEFFDQDKAWLFAPEDVSSIDFKESFLKKDYSKGPYFEDQPDIQKLLSLVPENFSPPAEATSQETSYYSLEDISL